MRNEDLLLHAWAQTVVGINYIIDQFGLGKKMRYPRIDSANYVVDSRYYRTALKDMFAYLSESTAGMKLPRQRPRADHDPDQPDQQDALCDRRHPL